MEKGFTITYEYGDNLYVNPTNRCNFNCEFCLRHGRKEGSIYTEDSLWLEREPTRQEALDSFLSRDVCSYREIVFCGYGEPTYRIEDILWLVDQLKERFGGQLPPVRINTNGHANLIHGRDVIPELKGRIDTLSISLNANNAADYTALCHPVQGEAAYQAMLDFAKEAKEEGFAQLAALFTMVGQIEKEHEERYRALAANLKEGKVFAREEQQVWVCRNCGYTHIGKSAPLKCPVCAHPQSYFELKAKNY